MPAPKRVDGTHRSIVSALRQIGAYVMDIHALPGCLDALVAYRGALTLLEIKDGSKPPSHRRLTQAEQETIWALAAVGVDAKVVCSVEDALRAVHAIV